MEQLLWIETFGKLAIGAILLLAPGAVIGLAGLASNPGGFWPRLLGAVLVGLAGATFAEGRFAGAQGLGLVGSILINLSMAGALVAMLVLRGAAPTWRGRFTLGIVAAALLLFSLVEIAFV